MLVLRKETLIYPLEPAGVETCRRSKLLPVYPNLPMWTQLKSDCQLLDSLAAVGVNHIGKELHPNNRKGVVEDD